MLSEGVRGMTTIPPPDLTSASLTSSASPPPNLVGADPITDKIHDGTRALSSSTSSPQDVAFEHSKPVPKFNRPSSALDRKSLPIFNEQTNYVTTSEVIQIFLAMSTLDLIDIVDQTCLGAAITIVAAELDARNLSVWISASYFTTAMSVQLIYARLSDIWTRKRMLLIAQAIFFIGSVGSSQAANAPQLIVFRAITGLGGGGLVNLAQMIISDVVPLRQRGKFQGILGAVVAISHGIGPIIGGAIASKGPGAWRWIFRLQLPLSFFSAAIIIFILPHRKVEGHWKKKLGAVDFVGGLLSVTGSGLLILSLTWAGADYPWKSVQVLATLFAAIASWAMFLIWEWKFPKLPLVPLHVFSSKIVVGAMFTSLVDGWSNLGQVFYMPSYYQLANGYTPLASALLLLPFTVTQSCMSTLSGWIIHWTGRYREVLIIGWSLWAIGLGLFSTLDENSHLARQIGYGILTGVGIGMTFQPSLIAIQAAVVRHDMAVTTGARNFVKTLGGTLGLTVSGTALNNMIRSKLNNLHSLTEAETRAIFRNPFKAIEMIKSRSGKEAGYQVERAVRAGYKSGFHLVFTIMAGLAALSALVTFAFIRQISLERPDDKDFKQEPNDTKEKAAPNNSKKQGKHDLIDEKKTDAEKNADMLSAG